jgi:hypothetical protein
MRWRLVLRPSVPPVGSRARHKGTLQARQRRSGVAPSCPAGPLVCCTRESPGPATVWADSPVSRGGAHAIRARRTRSAGPGMSNSSRHKIAYAFGREVF